MFKKTDREPGQSIMLVDAECDRCKGSARFRRNCGVFVCDHCEEHEGLVRCFCGWSASGGDGYRELIEMGENVEEDW